MSFEWGTERATGLVCLRQIFVPVVRFVTDTEWWKCYREMTKIVVQGSEKYRIVCSVVEMG